jgi:hypothetical protein
LVPARVEVSTWSADAPSTPGATAARHLSFGKPAVRTSGSTTLVDVEVTNTDAAAHSAFVNADFYDGDNLVGVANGAVNDLGAGQTKTATLFVTGKAIGPPHPFVGSVSK